MYVQGNDITLRTKFVLKFEIQKLFFSGVKKGGGGGGGNSLCFVWYRRAAGIAPFFYKLSIHQ